MGYRHDRDTILEGAVTVALNDGLDALTFGRVGRHLGISDRTVVYYFPTKEDLATAVLLAFGERLKDLLDAAFGSDRREAAELLARAWPVLKTTEAEPVFSVYFQAVGLAAAGRAPHRTLVPTLIEDWIAWIADRLAGPAAGRRARATVLVAQIDGLLLLRTVCGPDAADDAAGQLGV